jgi:hypothetical protein
MFYCGIRSDFSYGSFCRFIDSIIPLQSFNSYLFLRKIPMVSTKQRSLNTTRCKCACMNQVYTIVLMMACMGLVLTTQTAQGAGVIMQLTNGTFVGGGTVYLTVPPKAANELSYKYGYNTLYVHYTSNPYSVGEPMDSCRGPDVNARGQFIPITNKTACANGWAHAWKEWCTAHTKECVKDLLVGRVPDFVVATHHQYLAGYNYSTAVVGGWPGMCPAGHRNAAFCAGYQDNSGDYGDCNEEGPSEPSGLVGCPLDHMKHVAGFAPLVGAWHFVNKTASGHVVGTGTMTFDNGGNLTITYPSKTPFGDWTQQTSWGSDGHALTVCSDYEYCYLQFVVLVYDDHKHVILSNSDHHFTQYLSKVGANNTGYNYRDFNETNSQ